MNWTKRINDEVIFDGKNILSEKQVTKLKSNDLIYSNDNISLILDKYNDRVLNAVSFVNELIKHIDKRCHENVSTELLCSLLKKYDFMIVKEDKYVSKLSEVKE